MEWNGNFGMEDARMEWNGRQSSILPYQFHTRFRALYLQKNTYQCRVVINNTEVFIFSIYAYYLSTYRGTLVVYIAQTVYVLHHYKYVANLIVALMLQLSTLIDLTGCFFHFEADNLPSRKFCFLTSPRKLLFAISSPFQLNFIYIFSF